jgi:hypothetical protein
MKKILTRSLLFISGGILGYLIGVAPSVIENMNQNHVHTGYQWLLKDWPAESELMVSDPIPFPGYGDELDYAKQQWDIWKPHSYHTTSSFIDILSASPKAHDCCVMPEIGEEVRFLSALPHHSDNHDVLIRKNGDVIIAKTTINIPAMAW